MATFGKRLKECRETKGLSQQELAKQMGTSYTVIGKYERDEMIPSIEVAKKNRKAPVYHRGLPPRRSGQQHHL